MLSMLDTDMQRDGKREAKCQCTIAFAWVRPQALEVATWGAMLRAPRAVLAGDHLQLPPTIISEQAARKVMNLFDWLPKCCLPVLHLCHVCIVMQTMHHNVEHVSAGLTWANVHQGLRETLFERLQQQQASASAMLTVQYRMNSHIMRWSSDEFYGGRLTAHASVAEHTLHSLAVRYVGDEAHELEPGYCLG